jgi:hypothetical protein
MSFDRASAFYMGACQILSDEDQGMTPGERAAVYASLAQVEAAVSLARLIQQAFPEAATSTEVLQAEEVLAMSSARLIDRIAEDPRQP